MGRKKQHQPPLTVEEQITNLKELGLEIEDEEKAIGLLNDVSYFRLIKAYSLGLKPKNSNYNAGISFDRIIQLYKFNCKFRQLLFPIIERIEINLRCRLANSFLQTISNNGKNGKVANYEVSEELTQNKNVVLKGTLLHLVSAVANCSTQENSYGFEANVFNLWDIGTTVDTAPSNYLSVNFYINDKSISNMDIKSNLKVSIDKNVIAYAVIVLDVLAAIKMGDFGLAKEMAVEGIRTLCPNV